MLHKISFCDIIVLYLFRGGQSVEEIWKNLNIQGLEKYQVSNYGRIRNENTSQLLKPQKNIYGYMSIVLYKNLKYKKAKPCSFRIHRLVLQAFNPVENMEKLEVNHIDCNRSNNILNNLEWVTCSENCQRKALKESYYNSKGCYDDKGNYFNSYREAGRFYNISPNTVKRDCLGLTTRIENYEGREGRPIFHK